MCLRRVWQTRRLWNAVPTDNHQEYVMAGSALGALKRAAARVGLTVEEYQERRAAGEKWCTGCKDWHPVELFAVDRSRGDGLTSTCRDHNNSRGRATYVPRPRTPRVVTPEWRQRMAAVGRSSKGKPSPRLGVKHTPETRAKISAVVRERAHRGKDCHSYRDGKVAERRGERFSAKYRRWRFDVFSRDRFTCQSCGDSTGGNLVAHHLKGFAAFPTLRYEVSNGITWCTSCHDQHHKEHGYGHDDRHRVDGSYDEHPLGLHEDSGPRRGAQRV